MFKHVKRGLALFLAAVILLAVMPVQARAAQKAPEFQKKYSVFYENRANKGIYDLTVKNVKKGYILKWRITGKGKGYASFDTAKTVAESTKVTNRLTIDSRGEEAFAAAERIRITVNVYTAKWKLVQKLTFAGRLQSKAKAIDVDTSKIEDLSRLSAGKTYEFEASMTPANATSKIYWEVKDAAGTDYTSDITQDGKWTPAKAGTYTITALAKNSEKGQPLCKKEITATVGSFIESVTQTAADGIHATFNMAPAAQYKENDFTIKSGEATVLVKKVKYSDDGKTAYLTTATNFVDGRKYTVSCAGRTKEFTASVGKPAQLSIITTSAQKERYTTIAYMLLDEKGIDVTGTVKDGSFLYSANVNNGFLDPQTNRLYMTTIGNIATVTVDYTSPDGTIRLTDTKTVICVAQQAEVAAETKFTLTDSAYEPTYQGEDVRSIAVGDTMYAHFRGLDEDGQAIAYDSIAYASSDPDKLIINPDGKVTPIKPGPVTIVVTAKQGSDTVPYTFQITVNEGRYLAALQIKEPAIIMSNTSSSKGYQKEVPVTATDQYGGKLALTHETGVVTETAGQKQLATYDAATDSIVIRAQGAPVGTYNFILTVTMDGVSMKSYFAVIVSAPVPNGIRTYKAESSSDTMDLSVDSSSSGAKTIRVRLAEYRGGVFYDYKSFIRAEIRKGSTYYNENFTAVTTGSAIRKVSSDVLTLTPLSITAAGTDGIAACQKADPGVYTVTLTYFDSAYREQSESVNITITDGQNPPAYTVRSDTASTTMANALQLVNDCIYVPDGVILDCTATGTRLTGSMIPLRSGEQLHINTITVKSTVTIATGQKVYVTHVITIDKTLTNK